MAPSPPDASANGSSRAPQASPEPPPSDDPAPQPPPEMATPPVAPRRPAVLETHGDRRVDDWLWLRDRDDPEVIELLRAENAYTAAATAHLTGVHEHLFGEIRSRIVETDLSVPVRKDAWWYYTRTETERSVSTMRDLISPKSRS